MGRGQPRRGRQSVHHLSVPRSEMIHLIESIDGKHNEGITRMPSLAVISLAVNKT